MELASRVFYLGSTIIAATSPTRFTYEELGRVPMGLEFDVHNLIVTRHRTDLFGRVRLAFNQEPVVEFSSGADDVGTDHPQWKPGTFVALPGSSVGILFETHAVFLLTVRASIVGTLVTPGHFMGRRDRGRS